MGDQQCEGRDGTVNGAVRVLKQSRLGRTATNDRQGQYSPKMGPTIGQTSGPAGMGEGAMALVCRLPGFGVEGERCWLSSTSPPRFELA